MNSSEIHSSVPTLACVVSFFVAMGLQPDGWEAGIAIAFLCLGFVSVFRMHQFRVQIDGLTKSGLQSGEHIALPPGQRLRSIASFLFTKKTFERVFEPVLSDLELEYIEALAEDRKYKASYVHVRGVACFWLHFFLYLCTTAVGKVIKAMIAG